MDCPKHLGWKPGEACKVSAGNNIFHKAKHNCIASGVKYCWVHQSQVAGWTLHERGSQAANQLCKEKNSTWTGGWLEIPEAPNVDLETPATTMKIQVLSNHVMRQHNATRKQPHQLHLVVVDQLNNRKRYMMWQVQQMLPITSAYQAKHLTTMQKSHSSSTNQIASYLSGHGKLWTIAY